jgi:hypothetical protein
MIVSLLLAFALGAEAPAATTQQVALDKQASLTIPAGWEAKSYRMPMRGAINFRITSGDLRMAVTGIPKPKQADESPAALMGLMKDVSEEDKVKFDVMNASMQYVMLGGKPYSTDEEPTFKGTGYVGALMTVAAPGEEAIFPVFEGRKYQCVTTSVIKTETMAYVISVGSTSCSGADHTAAVAAIRSMVIAGG